MKKLKQNYWLIALIIPLLFTSCSKSDDENQAEAETFKTEAPWVPARAKKIKEMDFEYDAVIPYTAANGKKVWDKANIERRQGKGYVFLDEKYNVVYVVDWPGASTNAADGANKPFYFNFDTQDVVAEADALARTKTWHVKHFDIYNAFILTDYTTDNGQPGLGKLRIVRTPFDELDEAPAEPMIRVATTVEFEDREPVDGWGRYRLSDHILHPYKDRSFIFQLRDGRYVKYQLANMYRSNPDTVIDKYEYEAPFFNFRYYIQQTPYDRNIKTR